MKYHKFLLFFVVVLISCSNNNQKESISPYKQSYEENFAQLISRLISQDEGRQPDLCDTLYTEMYIALKVLSEDDKEAQQIVIDRVNQLLELDTIQENRRKYFEAAKIVYSCRKDYDNFWRMALKEFETYPLNSIQRNASLALFYTNVKSLPDSAKFYIEKTIAISKRHISSNDPKVRIDGYCANISMLILQGQDEAAKKYLKDILDIEKDKEIIEILDDILENYDNIKPLIVRKYYNSKYKIKL